MASPASSSSSSTSSSPSVHSASLVDPATHSPLLLELVDVKITRQVIEYTVDTVVDTVDYAMGRPSSSTRGRASKRPEHTKFTNFVDSVLTRAEVTTPTLLVSLVYVLRARPHLHIGLEQWALERVFLGALIVASKYLNDSTLKNVHWALCTSVFGKRDIGRIEREYLDVLNFDLKVSEEDVLVHHKGIAAALNLSPRPRVSTLLREPEHAFTERRHSRNRRASPPQEVPELEPDNSPNSSSPSSSSSSSSPRTPEHMDTTQDAYPSAKTHSASQRKPISIEPAVYDKGLLNQFLHAFPKLPSRLHT